MTQVVVMSAYPKEFNVKVCPEHIISSIRLNKSAGQGDVMNGQYRDYIHENAKFPQLPLQIT